MSPSNWWHLFTTGQYCKRFSGWIWKWIDGDINVVNYGMLVKSRRQYIIKMIILLSLSYFHLVRFYFWKSIFFASKKPKTFHIQSHMIGCQRGVIDKYVKLLYCTVTYPIISTNRKKKSITTMKIQIITARWSI